MKPAIAEGRHATDKTPGGAGRKYPKALCRMLPLGNRFALGIIEAPNPAILIIIDASLSGIVAAESIHRTFKQTYK
jgi:hypothetical protein